MGWTDAPKVEGGKWASAPAVDSNVVMETADGRIVRGADGKLSFVSPSYSTNDPATIKKIMGGAGSGELSRQGFDKSTLAQAPVAARGQAFLRGIPFVGSYFDEALGAIAGPEAKTGARAVAGAMERQNPIESAGLGLLGGVVGTAPAILAAPAAIPTGVAARTLPAVAGGLGLGAGAGAIEGAVYGAGEATEGNRMQGAGTGAAIGAATGGLLGAATPLVAKGVKNVAGLFNRSDVDGIARELGISKDAAKVIRNVFDQGGDIDAARAALLKAGDEGMLADAGFAAQSLMDTSIQQGGKAAQIGRSAIDERSAMIEPRLRGALDNSLGEAQGIESLQKSIREGSAASRGRFYDEAYSAEIDWRSPEGEKLRGLLESTPDSVLRKAAEIKEMSARPDNISAMYADEFAPSVSVKAGDFSGNYAEKQEIQQFFKELKRARRENFMKRPFTNTFKSLGVDPSGRLAQELRARGITPQTTVGLFRNGGLKEADNIDIEWFPEGFREILDRDGNYVSQQSIIDSLESELRGVPVDPLEKAAARSDLAALEDAAPEYLTRRLQLGKQEAEFARRAPTAPKDIATRGEIVPMKSVQDIDLIKRALDEIRYGKDGGLMGGPSAIQVEAGKRSREIRDLLGEISPAYKDALAVSADTIERVKAVEFGTSLLSPKTTREQVARFAEEASDQEKISAALGLRQHIDEVISNVKQNINNPRIEINQAIAEVKALSSDAAREKITAVIGAARAKPLFKILDESLAQLELRGVTARGSATAGRIAGKETIDQITSPSMVGQLMQGEPINTTKAMVQAITGQTAEYTATQRQQIYADIAKALTEKKGASARAALDYIDKAMKGQPLTAAQNEFVAQQVAGALFTTATPQATRAVERAK